jgi:DNA invertase Pin-like site-specific DNA recombinase
MMKTFADPKISKEHVARRAIVYLRQSSERQVSHNRESRELQYAMAERARSLGFQRVEIADEDLGSSAGVGAGRRDGFERLLAAVALGEVGIVISREVARLSRTDKDWCRLFEVCQVFDTLIGDDDRVYDLSVLDDQLVLGIKGTLSVVELKVIRKRLIDGQRNKARRGELFRTIAPGYALDALGRLVKDPDQRVQQAIALVFEKFRETGSIRQTLGWFHGHAVELPVNKPRNGKLEIIFQPPAMSLVAEILKNPIYAGAYVYGRRPTELVFVDGALKRRQRNALSPEQAEVFIRDHHESYIDWPTYEENQRIMRNNSYRGEHDESVGPARRGQGLLCGLLRCGRCGRKLHVRYWGKSGTSARYLCRADYTVGGSYCLRFGGGGVDRRFSEELLAVISPLGIEASLSAIEELDNQDDAQRKALEQKLEQAEYEARRAFEQYDEVDPRRRLVADELERRWNEKLQQVEAVKTLLTELDRQVHRLSDDEKADLAALGRHFRDVWFSPSCPPDLKKRIVRTVVEEIVVDEKPAGRLSFIVHWKGGTHTSFEMDRPQGAAAETTAMEDIELITRMAPRHGDSVTAGVLN